MSELRGDPVQRFRVGEIDVIKVVDVVEPTSPRFLFMGRTRDDFDPISTGSGRTSSTTRRRCC